MNRTAAHVRQEEISEYSFGDCELEQISADERELEIWNDAELLSEAVSGAWGDSVLTVRGKREWIGFQGESQSFPAVTLGAEALALLQRAYNAKTDAETRALAEAFGRKVYNDLVDYVREQAAQP